MADQTKIEWKRGSEVTNHGKSTLVTDATA